MNNNLINIMITLELPITINISLTMLHKNDIVKRIKSFIKEIRILNMISKEENYLKIILITNDILTKIRNYIKKNKKMFMKIFMELNATLITTVSVDTREKNILNFLNLHEIK